MQSSLIGKIQKAKAYAEERDRVQFNNFNLSFRGAHMRHNVAYDDGVLRCDCGFFTSWNMCSHTMALERMFRRHAPPRRVRKDLSAHPSLKTR